jgi:hypothetical protein
VIGRHYPAMALVAVKALVEKDAWLEIEATAVVQFQTNCIAVSNILGSADSKVRQSLCLTFRLLT